MNGKRIAKCISGISLLTIIGTVGSLEVGRLAPGAAIVAAVISLSVLIVSVGVMNR